MRDKTLIDEIRTCRRCPLPAESYPIAVPFTGQRFFLLGQAPGKDELKQNRPFSGPAGRNLFKWFQDAGLGNEDEVRARMFFSAVAPDAIKLRVAHRSGSAPREPLVDRGGGHAGGPNRSGKQSVAG